LLRLGDSDAADPGENEKDKKQPKKFSPF